MRLRAKGKSNSAEDALRVLRAIKSMEVTVDKTRYAGASKATLEQLDLLNALELESST